MKTNFIALCAFALSFIAFSSCSKADVETSQAVKFKVLSEETTKTHLRDGETRWSSNDVIYVLGTDGAYYKSEVISASDVAESEFTFTLFPETPQFALYVGRTLEPVVEDDKIAATLPAEQSINLANSFCNRANLTIGEVVKVDETTYGSILKNICGLLKFTVPAGITSVKIEGNNSEILSGVVYIDYNEGQPEWTAKTGENEVVVIPRKSTSGDVTTYHSGTYYACVLPQTFEEGITVTLTDINGYTAQTKGSNPLVLGRNKVVELPDLNIPKAPATVLEFDFTDTDTFPEDFPSGTDNSTTFEDPIMLTDTEGVQYDFTCSGTVCKANSSSTGLCFVLVSSKQTMTFPVINGKSITKVVVYGGNSSAKAVYLKNAGGTTVSDKGLPSATAEATLTPKDGTVASSLYNNAQSTYISKLILTYE